MLLQVPAWGKINHFGTQPPATCFLRSVFGGLDVMLPFEHLLVTDFRHESDVNLQPCFRKIPRPEDIQHYFQLFSGKHPPHKYGKPQISEEVNGAISLEGWAGPLEAKILRVLASSLFKID